MLMSWPVAFRAVGVSAPSAEVWHYLSQHYCTTPSYKMQPKSPESIAEIGVIPGIGGSCKDSEFNTESGRLSGPPIKHGHLTNR